MAGDRQALHTRSCPTAQWSGPLARLRSPRPLTANVDMTVDVKSYLRAHSRVRCSPLCFFRDHAAPILGGDGASSLDG